MLFISETIGHDSSFLVIFISVWAQSFEKMENVIYIILNIALERRVIVKET
jgi:hypothetical protein